MYHLHRERLLKMRDEAQLPQKLIIMVERAEHELKMLGGGSLTIRDLVILSAVVPRVKEPEEPRVPITRRDFGGDTPTKTSKKKRKTTLKR